MKTERCTANPESEMLFQIIIFGFEYGGKIKG
jgi:hypothetical protein